MKTYKISLLTGAILALAGTAAQAADPEIVPAETYQEMGLYLRADAGWSFLEWAGGDDDDGFAVGAGVGYRFSENMRTDLRVDYGGEYSVAPGADMSVTTVLGNLYFDLPTDTAFTPYVGAGVGYGWASIDNAKDKDGLAFGLMAGVGVDLTDSITIDAGYRFREVMTSGSDPMEHQILTGLRFEF
ncbi:MAG: porin family protein [Rhizobiales bacterium]|nr:porin family protein [Hyphomicrobiales bacterium]